MRWFRLILVFAALSISVSQGSAGIGIFGKKNKPNPTERVPELVQILKTDKDESKRATAAAELRQYDPTTFPDIVPVLIDVLSRDARPAVRAEAAESLGKVRPISQEAGAALEQALAKDTSMRVRFQARYALMGYHWAGYQSGKSKETLPPLAGSKEPAKGAPVLPAGGTEPPKGLGLSLPPIINTLPGLRPQAPVMRPRVPLPGETPPPPVLPTGPIGPGPVLDPPRD